MYDINIEKNTSFMDKIFYFRGNQLMLLHYVIFLKADFLMRCAKNFFLHFMEATDMFYLLMRDYCFDIRYSSFYS